MPRPGVISMVTCYQISWWARSPIDQRNAKSIAAQPDPPRTDSSSKGMTDSSYMKDSPSPSDARPAQYLRISTTIVILTSLSPAT